MIRKLSLAVAVAAALSPFGAFALGLGEIHPQSTLNQRFKADIDLFSVKRDELDGIKVELGSPEAFAKAGIDRPFILSGLVFTPTLAPDGRVVISITSKDTVREPFLNFLVEVNWPKGRLMREYTVLLDPPVTLDRQPPRLAAPVVRTAPVSQLQQGRRYEQTPLPVYTEASSMSGAREYGPVSPNDNLWNIAKRLKASGETTEQVMMALQRYNQGAFIRDNVNGLRVGKILRLPENADVTGISERQARREFLAQTKIWREGRGQTVTAPTPVRRPLDAPVAADRPAVEPEDRLELISAKTDESQEALDQVGMAEAAGKVTQLERELMLARESDESTRQENEVLQSRVRELEAQISDIQRLLTLKSDQLTELQASQRIVAERTEAIETIRQETLDQPIVSGLPESEEILPIPAGTLVEEEELEYAIEEPMQAEPAVPEVAAVEPEEPAQQVPSVEPTIQTPVVSTPEPVAQQEPIPVPAPATPKRGGFLDILMGNTTLMGIIGAVGILLLSLLWLIMRRRKEVEAEFAESILVTPDGKSVADNVQAGTGSINEPTDETSFMSDFSPSDIDALQDETGEVDPLSEADVYIAYGRYQQAEELIKQALERFPEREELKDKLLEIYFSAKNKTQFNQLAEEMHHSGAEKEKPDTWKKIAGMGQELDPGNALYAVAAGAAAVALHSVADDELDDLGLSLDSGFTEDGLFTSSETPAEPPLSEADDLVSLDLSDLDNLDEMESESLESGLSLDSEFLDNLEANQADQPGQANQAVQAEQANTGAKSEFVEADSLDLDVGETASEFVDTDSLDMDLGETASELVDTDSLDMDLEETKSEFVEADSLDIDLGETASEFVEADSLDIDLGETASEFVEADSLDIDLGETASEFLEADSLDMDVGETASEFVEADSLDIDVGETASEFVEADSLDIDVGETASEFVEADSLDINLAELEKEPDSFSKTADDSLLFTSMLDESSEITGLDLPDLDTNIVGIEDSESLEDLDLESLEKELEMLSGDLEAQGASTESKDDFSLTDETDSLNSEIADEVTTKLDLALAYVDMGDSEGARSILEEVIGEGDDNQKQKAKELLDNMPG